MHPRPLAGDIVDDAAPRRRRNSVEDAASDHETAGAAVRLADQIAQQILDGTYRVGDKLPGERELARQFAVSRPTVRSALQTLTARGFLRVRNRSGAYVLPPSAGPVSHGLLHLISTGRLPVRVRDLIEVRKALEEEMAALAAERRTQEDLREIGRALADTASAETPEAWAEADVAFHGSLARATGNPLFGLIYDVLREVLLEQRLRTGTALPATRAQSFRYHQRIYDRVFAGDGPGARKAMREHLREAQETMVRYAVEMTAELVAVKPPAPRDVPLGGDQAGYQAEG